MPGGGGRAGGGGRFSSGGRFGRSSSASAKSSSKPSPRTRSNDDPPGHVTTNKKEKDDLPAPVQASGGGSVTGGIGSSFTDGMAWGAGNAVGHRLVDGVAGPRTIQHETVVSQAAPTDACSVQAKPFQDCLNSSDSDISKCQFYFDMLVECKRNSGSKITVL